MRNNPAVRRFTLKSHLLSAGRYVVYRLQPGYGFWRPVNDCRDNRLEVHAGLLTELFDWEEDAVWRLVSRHEFDLDEAHDAVQSA